MIPQAIVLLRIFINLLTSFIQYVVQCVAYGKCLIGGLSVTLLLFLLFLFTTDLVVVVVKVKAVGNYKFQNGQGKKSKYGGKGKVLLSKKPVSGSWGQGTRCWNYWVHETRAHIHGKCVFSGLHQDEILSLI